MLVTKRGEGESIPLIQHERRRGRPPSFETEDAFRVASGILLSQGIGKLTLLEVARRLGTSHQALGQRFSSRDGFLNAYADWLRGIILDDIRAIIASTSSPLAAAREIAILPINPRVIGDEGPPRQAVASLLGIELQREPIIHARNLVPDVELASIFTQLVERAQAAGELAPADPGEVFEAVFTAVTGAAILWTFQPLEDLVEKMIRCRERALAPFLVGDGR
jgi:AcrR family transcriptional regulator